MGCTPSATEDGSGVGKTESVENVAQGVTAWTLPAHAQVGYWHNFKNPSGCPFPLRQVATRAPYWDVINVSFAERDPAGDGTVAFHVFANPQNEGCSLTGLSEQNFKDDITYLKGLGKIVVLSLGGAEGTITLASATNQTNFTNSLTSIINTYGFQGVDIDYEGGSGISHEGPIIKNKYLSNGIKGIRTNTGGNMYLSMAPEHPYVHGGTVAYSGIWGSYLPLINDLRNELTLLHTQLYNNSSVSNPWGTYPVDSVDNLVASVKMLVEGFTPSGGTAFAGLPASKIAFGVPSGPKSVLTNWAGNRVKTQTIKDAYNCITANTNCGTLHMASNQPTFRGVMSWSINWDEYDKSANTPINSEPYRVDFAALETHMGGASCTPSCTNRTCGDNGCGGSCGTCPGGQTCNGSGQCQTTCTPKTCAQISATCGAPSNGCGGTLSCGVCSSNWECSSSFTCVDPLKAHYNMDTLASGVIVDTAATSGSFSQATTTKRPTVVTGRIGSAFQFDGVDDELQNETAAARDAAHAALSGGAGVSVSAWIKNDGAKAGCTGTACRQHVYTSTAHDGAGSLILRLTENYELSCLAKPGTGTGNPLKEAKVQYTWQGQWIHVVCTADAPNDKIRVYVNGQEVTNVTAAWTNTTFVNANSTYYDGIGAGGSIANRYFKGAIDQLKLFSKALTVSEVQSLYAEGGSSCTPLTCQAGDCGAKPNGCGGTLACGQCAAGQSCNASFRCETTCTPLTCSATNCGTMTNGCGGTLNCGSCQTGFTCNSSNACVSVPDGGGGGCASLQPWSSSDPWTSYTSGTLRKHNNKKWTCHTPGWCYLEPGGANTTLGWTDNGGC